MDFYRIDEEWRKSEIIISPVFEVKRSKDLMVRGKGFYAIWDSAANLWSTDEYDVARLVDAEIDAYLEAFKTKHPGTKPTVRYMRDFSSNSWKEFRKYLAHLSDCNNTLDDHVTFTNSEVKRRDYVSKKVPYPLEAGSIEAYDELISTLYDPAEREKLEWAIGSIVSGDSRTIQKFIVLYGEAGAGKSTVLNIIQKLFEGYYTTFEAKALTSANNQFATEAFRNNPLVAIQHDGDLSRIEDNSKLNSIVSHEEMQMNEKYKSSYTSRINAFLFMATNKPVKITDAKSGIIRRLIDVKPSGRRVPARRYQTLVNQMEFELGAIANHCLEVYRELGKSYYNSYRPLEMMEKTDVFYNFVEDNFLIFKEQDGITLSQAYTMYKAYCEETALEFKLPRYKFREELKNYFSKFEPMTRVDGAVTRSYYSGFMASIFTQAEGVKTKEVKEGVLSLVLEEKNSVLDDILGDCPAQYATDDGKPISQWDSVKTALKDINTRETHYVRPPIEHIVIDFDLKGADGQKDPQKNLEAAAQWPATYAEFSRGGGIHLHYIYSGDPNTLSRVFGDGIEIKVFVGKSSLRRKLSLCNNIPIATLNGGLPLKGVKVINADSVKSEVGLRKLIVRNLRKEIHPGTKPSIDFIHKLLEDAYSSGMKYDVSDMRPAVMVFANNSTNQSEYCVKLVTQMKFASEEPSEAVLNEDQPIVFFDVEVYPNLFIVCWKYDDESTSCQRMINPTPKEIEALLNTRLIGFNCRRYDNHILYARYIGYTNEQLFELSQRIINKSRNAMFGEAYNLSYADVFDFSTEKMSLKKFEVDLGLHHQEMDLPWDQPVPKELWMKVAEYCDNDVIATQAVFHAKKDDWAGRQILAALTGMTPNDSTQALTSRFIFGAEKNPQEQFVYTDLSKMFPGYEFKFGVSSYRGENPSEGGYVYAEPGIHTNVAVLDVASMHPHSIKELNLFGPYTQRFYDLVLARLAVKHRDWETAGKMLNGALKPYLSEESADGLSHALKIAINSVYGLTSASFDTKFKDRRNIDNIVAKRGALFMIDLKHAVQEQGFTVAHIKTDSIKIPNATPEIIKFVMDFGAKYGYTFEHETTYERMCLVNDAVYISYFWGWNKKMKANVWQWNATGAQFQEPYIFKTLFSKEPIVFDDLTQRRAVESVMYLDMNEQLPDVSIFEKELAKFAEDGSRKNPAYPTLTADDIRAEIAKGHNYLFVGKVGNFCPIKPGCGGGLLMRYANDKYYSVTGTKGYRWLEAELVKKLGRDSDIDMTYFTKILDKAISAIAEYGDAEWFINGIPTQPIAETSDPDTIISLLVK